MANYNLHLETYRLLVLKNQAIENSKIKKNVNNEKSQFKPHFYWYIAKFIF